MGSVAQNEEAGGGVTVLSEDPSAANLVVTGNVAFDILNAG